MQLHELVREEYRKDRYLTHLTKEELDSRAKDILENLITLTENGQIGVLPPQDEFWVKFVHVLEEFIIRDGQGSKFEKEFVERLNLLKTTFPKKPKAIEIIKGFVFPKKYLVKYGKHEHLKECYERGAIRISPASFYNDPSLNYAIKDDELKFKFLYPPSDIKMELRDEKTGTIKGRIDPIGNIEFSIKTPVDYYIYCLSSVYDVRLFDDFEADACLLITKPKLFLENMISAFKKKLPSWEAVHTSVLYLDPIRGSLKRNTDLYFSKHFRYSYQKEFRIIWIDPDVKEKIDYVVLDLGNLKEYCNLLVL